MLIKLELFKLVTDRTALNSPPHQITLGTKSACLSSLLHFRYYKIGVVVLFLHDVSDVVLECTKLCLAAKSRGGKYRIIPDILSIVGFLSFASLW